MNLGPTQPSNQNPSKGKHIPHQTIDHGKGDDTSAASPARPPLWGLLAHTPRSVNSMNLGPTQPQTKILTKENTFCRTTTDRTPQTPTRSIGLNLGSLRFDIIRSEPIPAKSIHPDPLNPSTIHMYLLWNAIKIRPNPTPVSTCIYSCRHGTRSN